MATALHHARAPHRLPDIYGTSFLPSLSLSLLMHLLSSRTDLSRPLPPRMPAIHEDDLACDDRALLSAAVRPHTLTAHVILPSEPPPAGNYLPHARAARYAGAPARGDPCVWDADLGDPAAGRARCVVVATSGLVRSHRADAARIASSAIQLPRARALLNRRLCPRSMRRGFLCSATTRGRTQTSARRMLKSPRTSSHNTTLLKTSFSERDLPCYVWFVFDVLDAV